jgi:anti-sigma factor (TIGR02949 family)
LQCAESLRVQAYFDGELDAPSAAELERHSETCEECRALLQDLERVRTALRQDLTYANAPPALRARVMRALDQESAVKSPRPHGERQTSWRSRPFWKGAFSGIAGTALAAGIAFFILAPSLTNPVLDDLVSAHVRSLMPDHLIDVVSTDKHTVKPWFAGHTDVSPVVADFDQQGYRLIGGRADYFDHQRAAVVVYQHGSHVINVFSWAADQRGLPKNTTRNGYHLAFWKVGNLVYCAVSDTAWDELMGLAQLLQNLAAHDNRE